MRRERDRNIEKGVERDTQYRERPRERDRNIEKGVERGTEI
jgi:hypothetical protein